MANFVTLAQPYFNGNANATVTTTPCSVQGIFITSTTPGTITLTDTSNIAAAGGTVVLGPWLPPSTGWFFMPFRCNNGLAINVSNTTTYTISVAG